MATRIKKTVTSKEVEKLIAEGWSFRLKKVKGRTYISTRKGKNENGLGAYSEESWTLITKLLRKGRVEDGITENEPSKLNNITGPNVEALGADARNWLSIQRTIHKIRRCLFKDSDDFCTYWQWLKEPPIIFQGAEYLAQRKVEGNGEYVWYLKALDYVCWDCPVFVDERVVELLERRFAERCGVLPSGRNTLATRILRQKVTRELPRA